MVCIDLFFGGGENNLNEHLVHSLFSLIIADSSFFFTLFSAKTDFYAYLFGFAGTKKTRREDRSPFV
ncbi:protein of unknown function [Bacillus sp. CN2]|nr:protein of unknown function [Bacillus sp. CN2]